MGKYLYNDNNNVKEKNAKYKIKGVVIYTYNKENDSGHFISYIYEDNVWYEYNDSSVSAFVSVPPLVNSNCYLLFYEKLYLN